MPSCTGALPRILRHIAGGKPQQFSGGNTADGLIVGQRLDCAARAQEARPHTRLAP